MVRLTEHQLELAQMHVDWLISTAAQKEADGLGSAHLWMVQALKWDCVIIRGTVGEILDLSVLKKYEL